MLFAMTSGNGSRGICPAAPRASVALGPITACFWTLFCGWRSGGRWRDLPERYGDYQSVKRRYYRWIEMGVLDDMLAVLAREADLEWLMIDSTIVRAHSQAAGARKDKGGRMPRAWVGLAAA